MAPSIVSSCFSSSNFTINHTNEQSEKMTKQIFQSACKTILLYTSIAFPPSEYALVNNVSEEKFEIAPTDVLTDGIDIEMCSHSGLLEVIIGSRAYHPRIIARLLLPFLPQESYRWFCAEDGTLKIVGIDFTAIVSPIEEMEVSSR